jgi:hypothetical protein
VVRDSSAADAPPPPVRGAPAGVSGQRSAMAQLARAMATDRR